jgi:hypothetical protein
VDGKEYAAHIERTKDVLKAYRRVTGNEPPVGFFDLLGTMWHEPLQSAVQAFWKSMGE